MGEPQKVIPVPPLPKAGDAVAWFRVRDGVLYRGMQAKQEFLAGPLPLGGSGQGNRQHVEAMRLTDYGIEIRTPEHREIVPWEQITNWRPA